MFAKYEFAKVLDVEGGLLWIGVRTVAPPTRFFVYVSNTGKWHRYPELEPGDGYVEGVQFESITQEKALELVASLNVINEDFLDWVIDEFKSQEELTTLELVS